MPLKRAALPSTIALTALMMSLSAFVSLQAWSQVNVEQSRPESQEGVHARLDSALTVIRGNVDLTQLALSGRVEYKRGVHSPFIQASVNYGEKADEPFLDQAFVHARWTSMWWGSWGSELFAQLQEDSFRRLTLRQLYGGGLRAQYELGSPRPETVTGAPPTGAPAQQRSVSLVACGLGAMWERERAQDVMGGGALEENNLRLTSYLTLRHTIHAATEIKLSSTLYYQPLARALDDHRALWDATVEVTLSDHVSLVESINLLYDSAPPPDVIRYDIKSMTAIRLTI